METQGLEGKFDARKGLQVLLTIEEIGKMHRRLPTADFLQRVIVYAGEKAEAAKTSPEVAQVWDGYAKIAGQLLVIERKRVPIPTTALDADSKPWHDPEGRHYIVVGGGPQEGGYALSFNRGEPLRW